MSEDRILDLHVDGVWQAPAGGGRYVVVSPVTGEPVAYAADAARDDADRAVRAAAAAYATYRHTPVYERAALCHRVADHIQQRAEPFARDVTLETGRPLVETRAELDKATEGFRLAAEEVKRLHGDAIPVRDPAKLVTTRWYPTGPWAVLSPWNFPVNIPVEYLGPAVAAGNTVVWKPAPSTPLSAGWLVACLEAAEVPPGVVNLVTTSDTAVAESVVSHEAIVGVGLTGSTPTGRAVARAAAEKRRILELGGNGPILVFDDADVDAAADAVATSCFTASGQICSAGGRVLVGPRHGASLAEAVGERVAGYPLGDPFEAGVRLGPVHLPSLAQRISEHVDDAVERGARLVTGGRPLEDFPTQQFFPPTVLADVDVAARVNREETFGPVAPVVPVGSDAELFSQANQADHALTVAVFTQDVDRALAAADQLDFGSVVINDRSTYWELHLPFGGWEGRASGQGRVGVAATLRQMSQTKTVSFHQRPAASR